LASERKPGTSRLDREKGGIPDPAKLKDYLFYPAAQGEFHLLAGRPAEARKHFEKAVKLARSPSETNFFERKLKATGS
jgi:predicted RNA polymerase sigma factor